MIFYVEAVTSAIVDVATAIDSELCGLANVECLQEKSFMNCNTSATFTKNFLLQKFPTSYTVLCYMIFCSLY